MQPQNRQGVKHGSDGDAATTKNGAPPNKKVKTTSPLALQLLKNPIGVLNERLPNLEYIADQYNEEGVMNFKVTVLMNGREYSGSAKSKKQAKFNAASQALQCLIQTGAFQEGGSLQTKQVEKAPVATGAAVSSDPAAASLTAGNNPLLMLHKLRPGTEFELVSEIGEPHNKNFTFSCYVDNQTFTYAAQSKKAARAGVARLALSKCCGVVVPAPPAPKPAGQSASSQQLSTGNLLLNLKPPQQQAEWKKVDNQERNPPVNKEVYRDNEGTSADNKSSYMGDNQANNRSSYMGDNQANNRSSYMGDNQANNRSSYMGDNQANNRSSYTGYSNTGNNGNKRRGGYGLYQENHLKTQLQDLSGPQYDIIAPPESKSLRKFSNNCRLWIGSLPKGITVEFIKELFQPYGEFEEVYYDEEKKFGFIRMDYKVNAEKARQELHYKYVQGSNIVVRYSSPGCSLKVRNLSVWVTNELLWKSFSVFGELEKAIIVTDDRGKPTGSGIVEFCKKPAANWALKKCTTECFFITNIPRPVIVEPLTTVYDGDGLKEMDLNQRSAEYFKERQVGPRFASNGDFEDMYGNKWKQVYEIHDKKLEMLEKELVLEEKKLQEEIEYSQHERETELLREQVRLREEASRFNETYVYDQSYYNAPKYNPTDTYGQYDANTSYNQQYQATSSYPNNW